MKPGILAQLKKAGIVLPEGTKARKVKLPKPDPGPVREPGTLIAGFFVDARPVPWSAPRTTRSGVAYKAKSLVGWQEMVARRGRVTMGRTSPYGHPVRLVMTFYLCPKGNPPDLSNLGKGCEDALQGSVIVNDTQVAKITSERIFGNGDGAHIEVIATGDE